MSELIITEKEKEDFSFLDWDSESIGNAVKDAAVKLCQYKKDPHDETGIDLIFMKAAMLVVITLMKKSNAETLTQDLIDVTVLGESVGNYKMQVTKMKGNQ